MTPMMIRLASDIWTTPQLMYLPDPAEVHQRSELSRSRGKRLMEPRFPPLPGFLPAVAAVTLGPKDRTRSSITSGRELGVPRCRRRRLVALASARSSRSARGSVRPSPSCRAGSSARRRCTWRRSCSRRDTGLRALGWFRRRAGLGGPGSVRGRVRRPRGAVRLRDEVAPLLRGSSGRWRAQACSRWSWTAEDTRRVLVAVPLRPRAVEQLRDISYVSDATAAQRLDLYRRVGRVVCHLGGSGALVLPRRRLGDGRQA